MCLRVVPKLLTVAWNTDSAKTFQANFIIYGNKQGVNQKSLGIWRFRGIGKNQNWVETKCNPNTNGIQEALRVYWQDLGVKEGGKALKALAILKYLRILTRKKHPKIKLSSIYEKYQYSHLSRWYIKLTLFKEFLKLEQIFQQKKKVVTGQNSTLCDRSTL